MLLLIASGCANRPDRSHYVSIGYIDGLDFAGQNRVLRLLNENGIESVIGGSVLYSINVQESDRIEAANLLAQEADADSFNLVLDINGSQVQYKYSEPQIVISNIPTGLLSEHSTVMSSWHLNQLVKSKAFTDLSNRFAQVDEIATQARPDGSERGSLYICVKLTVSSNQEIAGSKTHYLVDNTGEIHSMGGSEWMKGTKEEIDANRKEYGF